MIAWLNKIAIYTPLDFYECLDFSFKNRKKYNVCPVVALNDMSDPILTAAMI